METSLESQVIRELREHMFNAKTAASNGMPCYITMVQELSEVRRLAEEAGLSSDPFEKKVRETYLREGFSREMSYNLEQARDCIANPELLEEEKIQILIYRINQSRILAEQMGIDLTNPGMSIEMLGKALEGWPNNHLPQESAPETARAGVCYLLRQSEELVGKGKYADAGKRLSCAIRLSNNKNFWPRLRENYASSRPS